MVMLGVNTDPVATSLDSASPLKSPLASGTVKQWHFLTGTVNQLDSVWKAYGVGIEVQTSTHLVSHNNVLYFIDGKGRLRLRATPFADENRNGTYSLALNTETRFASGIASSVRSLLPGLANIASGGMNTSAVTSSG